MGLPSFVPESSYREAATWLIVTAVISEKRLS